jgi:hypothetical protein
MLSELPEGDGIAAKYPGDAGIEEDPAVVLADDFEGFEDDLVATEPVGQKGMKWDVAWHQVRITRDPANVHSGRLAVEMRHEEPMSHGLSRDFEDGFDTLFVRYYLKFHPQFPGCHHTGMGMWAGAPGIILASGTDHSATGVKPDGRSHFTARLDTSPPWTPYSDASPGRANMYSYHMDQGRRYGDLFFPSGEIYPPENRALLGEGFVARDDFQAERGRWYCYEFMLAANTPGERDGRIAFWVDGRLTGDFAGLRYRSDPALKINHVVLGTYSSSRHDNKVMWYDDVVVATSYIGPQRPAAAP